MENRIKEQMCLFADRMSAETMRANQLRLYLSAAAYVLVEALRRLALKGTELVEAQVDTIRLRLLKIGARVRVTVRRLMVSMASGFAAKHHPVSGGAVPRAGNSSSWPIRNIAQSAATALGNGVLTTPATGSSIAQSSPSPSNGTGSNSRNGTCADAWPILQTTTRL